MEKSGLEDSLSQARLLHYILIAAAVSGLGIAFTKHNDLIQRYDLAIEDLQTIGGFVGGDWKEGGNQMRDEFKPLNLGAVSSMREELSRRASIVANQYLVSLASTAQATEGTSLIPIKLVYPWALRTDLPITFTVTNSTQSG
jgi:hypothetical protein